MTILISILFLGFNSCFLGVSKPETITGDQQPKITYPNFLSEVKTEREKLKDKPLADAKKYFFKAFS